MRVTRKHIMKARYENVVRFARWLGEYSDDFPAWLVRLIVMDALEEKRSPREKLLAKRRN